MKRIIEIDGGMVKAMKLLNQKGVEQIKAYEKSFACHHIMFDQIEMIYANGAVIESLCAGSEAINAISTAARDEWNAVFSELCLTTPMLERELLRGQEAKGLIVRSSKTDAALIVVA